MTVREAEDLYREDVFVNIHPEDVDNCRIKIDAFLQSSEEYCELSPRFQRRDGSYIWIRVHISLSKSPDGVRRLYCVYTDIDQVVAEKEQMSRQYEELILQHYRTPGPDTLILGHCNITQNRVLENRNFTDSKLWETFGWDRESF